MQKLKIVYPTRAAEFRVTFRGQNTPQCPVVEIVAVTGATHSHEMRATYDPHLGVGYDPNRWFIRMPQGIKMNEMRRVMRAIRPAIAGRIDAMTRSAPSVLWRSVTTEALTDAVNAAIRDYVVNTNARDYVTRMG